MPIAINTLAYARRLREAGVSEIQAEAHAEALAAAMTDTLATKQDLRELETRMHAGFAATKQDLSGLETRMHAGFAAAKHDLRELEIRMDARFEQVDARMDARFAQVDARFEYLEKHIDTRLSEQEKRLDNRLGEQEKRIEIRFSEHGADVRGQLADLERRMTMRLGTVTVAAIGVVSALVKVL